MAGEDPKVVYPVLRKRTQIAPPTAPRSILLWSGVKTPTRRRGVIPLVAVESPRQWTEVLSPGLAGPGLAWHQVASAGHASMCQTRYFHACTTFRRGEDNTRLSSFRSPVLYVPRMPLAREAASKLFPRSYCRGGSHDRKHLSLPS